MREKRSREKNIFQKVSSALSLLWEHIKKAASAAGVFFAALISKITGLFRRGIDSDIFASDSDASDETRVFEKAEDASNPPKTKPLRNRRQEMPHISREHLSGEGKDHINMFMPKQHTQNFLVGILLTSFKLILIGIFMIGAAGIGTLTGIAKAYMDTTPTLNTAEIENQSETSYICDRNGEIITMYTGSENRDWGVYRRDTRNAAKRVHCNRRRSF